MTDYDKYKAIMVEENDQNYARTAKRNILLKIVILGDGGVGKSCLMSRFISNHFDDHNFHTIGVEFMNKMTEVGGKQYTLQVFFILFLPKRTNTPDNILLFKLYTL